MPVPGDAPGARRSAVQRGRAGDPRRRFASAALLAAWTALAAPAHAQPSAAGFPSKPVRIVVNFPPGGPSDLMARAIGERLTTALKQPFVVDFRAGAAGNIGADAAAKAAPDGYTMLFCIDTTFTANPTLYPSMPFKPGDLKPLVMIATSGLTFGAHPSLGVSTVAEFLAKARGQETTFSNAGNGSPGHLAASILADKEGLKVVTVPYKGNTPAVLALVSGEVQAGILATPGLMPHVQAGKVKPLAVTSRKRSPLAPEVPTVIEAGLPQLEFEVLYLAMVPAATPEPIAAILQREIVAALAVPEVRDKLTRLDLDVIGETGPGVAERLARLRERYAATIRATGMKAD
jgi:tripartite-type tricarboxylate transporter receptor subunit TctC